MLLGGEVSRLLLRQLRLVHVRVVLHGLRIGVEGGRLDHEDV